MVRGIRNWNGAAVARSPGSAEGGGGGAAVRSLDVLPAGAGGCVQAVRGDADTVGRLRALGLCEGRHVEVLRTGNPVIVRVLRARVGLSPALARHVELGHSDHVPAGGRP